MRALDREESDLATLNQVHSPDVVSLRGDEEPAAGTKADALVTDRPGRVLGILTADCAPVLFADPERGVIAAAHAGWRGAIAGVLEATLAEMERLGARREAVAAAVGPCMAQASYEVGPEFPAPFLAQDPENARFFAPGPAGKDHFDLKGYVARRLRLAGVAAVAVEAADTCAETERFFSHRANRKQGIDDYGRLLSAIVLEE